MCALAFDVGGTKIAAGLCDEDDRIIERWRVPTPPEPERIDRTIASIYREAKALHSDIGSIGISAWGNVTSDRRTMCFAPNIAAWHDYPLADKVEALIDHECPVVVENDANCAGWGEYAHGAGRGSSHMIMLTVGIGLGGVIIADGKLYRGAFGMAGELGHITMVPDGDFCGCGLRGCAERYISGNTLERFARCAVRRRPQEAGRLMELCGGDIDALKGTMIAQAVQEGDVLAQYAFDKVGEWLGRVMEQASAMLDPELFVIGGGVVEVGDVLRGPQSYGF